MIKVMIVDDQKVFREGLRMIIEQDELIEVVGLCGNGQEALDYIGVYHPKLILMDIQMPIMNGVEAVKELKATHPEIDVIMLTTFHDESYIYDAVKNGASGYLLKDTDIDVIIKAIKTVYDGGALMDPEVTKIMMSQFTKLATGMAESDLSVLDVLTEREVDIAYLVSDGLNNKEIAEKLFLGEGTVKNHLTKILQKLELRDRTQLAIFILKLKN